ncbi:hypothetical protein CLOM_g20879 [Closterium sp. NIES-68]|nr:hypothetical protein CLOM_g20879 [Closterium sp. NIES-68]GJP68497.1 hypothetical protein CLOP_g25197 [Closterium sp. NIES-67]
MAPKRGGGGAATKGRGRGRRGRGGRQNEATEGRGPLARSTAAPGEAEGAVDAVDCAHAFPSAAAGGAERAVEAMDSAETIPRAAAAATGGAGRSAAATGVAQGAVEAMDSAKAFPSAAAAATAGPDSTGGASPGMPLQHEPDVPACRSSVGSPLLGFSGTHGSSGRCRAEMGGKDASEAGDWEEYEEGDAEEYEEGGAEECEEGGDSLGSEDGSEEEYEMGQEEDEDEEEGDEEADGWESGEGGRGKRRRRGEAGAAGPSRPAGQPSRLTPRPPGQPSRSQPTGPAASLVSRSEPRGPAARLASGRVGTTDTSSERGHEGGPHGLAEWEEGLRHSLAAFVADAQLPTSFVDRPAFHRLMVLLNPECTRPGVMPSRSAIAQDIMRMGGRARRRVVQEMLTDDWDGSPPFSFQ